MLAEWTGLEPATPGVTGRYSNQLNYHSAGVRQVFDYSMGLFAYQCIGGRSGAAIDRKMVRTSASGGAMMSTLRDNAGAHWQSAGRSPAGCCNCGNCGA